MTAPLVVFPDVEQDLGDFYVAALALRTEAYVEGVEVRTRVPDENRPPVLVTVRRAGGVGAHYLDNPRMDVQVWHRTDVEARDLAALVRGLSWQARGYRSFRGMRESGGLVPVPDTDGTPRYMFTVEFTVKGATP